MDPGLKNSENGGSNQDQEKFENLHPSLTWRCVDPCLKIFSRLLLDYAESKNVLVTVCLWNGADPQINQQWVLWTLFSRSFPAQFWSNYRSKFYFRQFLLHKMLSLRDSVFIWCSNVSIASTNSQLKCSKRRRNY